MILDIFKIPVFVSKLNFENFNHHSIVNKLKNQYIEDKLKTPKHWICNTKTFDIDVIKDYRYILDIITDNTKKFLDELLANYKNGIFLTDAWFNYSVKNDYQEFHIHTKRHISGVYYIKAPKNCGNIIFRKPNLNMFELNGKSSKEKTYLNETYFFTPEEGLLLLFPSNLEHLVEKNLSDEERVSLSFNYVIKDENE